MTSQTDLDQGGTFRQLQRVYMGPSVGWQLAPATVILPVTSASATVQPGNSLVTVNYNGAVTIQLPSAQGNVAGAGVVPGTWIPTPITIVDVGGLASSTNVITILPHGTETIVGLTSLVIDSPYGAYVLNPNDDSGGWTFP